MVSSLICGTITVTNPCFCSSASPTFNRNSSSIVGFKKVSTLSSSSKPLTILHKSMLPLAASIAVLLSSAPANAGFLSGSTGLESIPGPQLPQIDFLTRFNEENQKKYAEADARFKESPLLKQFLEKSNLNKDKNRQAIQDKYCLRGAEWGVGDCSAAAMTPEDRDKFIAMLKEKVGVE